jgi:thiamine transporter
MVVREARRIMRDQRVAVLVEIALAIALAAVLNTLKIWRMPNAGTVSFVMLPITVLALRRGLLVGLVTGALYGVLDFFIDPYPPVHWIQPLLDYPVAYACVGLAGIVALAWRSQASRGPSAQFPWLVIAVAVATVARYAVHVVSGVVFFGEYAPPGQPVLVYSLIYNLYVPLSGALALAAAAVVLPALQRAVPAPDARSRA